MTEETLTDTQLETLLETFTELSAISGVSKKEKPVNAYIRQSLKDLPFTVEEDSAGEIIGGNSGNLLIYPESYSPEKPAIMLLAHMDTVRPTGESSIIRKEDRVESDGSGQIGADNRMGITILLQLLKEWEERGFSDLNAMICFTVAEEIGLLGSYNLTIPDNIDMAFVFDSSKRPGTYIQRCAGMYLFEAKVIGVSAHSAVQPEAGISAVEVMAQILSKLKFGKISDEVTSNIGMIKGGTATNVIPGDCIAEGEVRAMSVDDLHELLNNYRKAFEDESKKLNASVKWSQEKDFAPYEIVPESSQIRLLSEAMKNANLTPDPISYTGGSDANVLNEKGVSTINLGIGAQNPHSDHECILHKDFISSLNLAFQICRLALNKE